MAAVPATPGAVFSPGRPANTGDGPSLVPVDIDHAHYIGLVDPDTAFWSLIRKEELGAVLGDAAFLAAYQKQSGLFAREMDTLRFGLGLSAVYINPTERCNLDCSYCYIPAHLRRGGGQMSRESLFRALEILKRYFSFKGLGRQLPQIIFHGAEPLLCRENIFAAIERHGGDFRFGIQTNGTLLDRDAVDFIKATGTGLGLSLDASRAEIADLTRKTWSGVGVFQRTLAALEMLRGYPGYNVICTVTRANMAYLEDLVAFFHERKVPAAMLNMVRCTLEPARAVKPADAEVFPYFRSALERTQRLYKETGRKLVIANFANILVSILAPTARRLMCDISPCGGGRVFFALSPDGGMYPCSEFIGLDAFRGGNLFKDDIGRVLETAAFCKVTGRKVEDIFPCRRCAIRHFCGAPCSAEAHEMKGAMHHPGAFCEFYEEQVRFALRIIAEGRADDYLWDGWDKDTKTIFDAEALFPKKPKKS